MKAFGDVRPGEQWAAFALPTVVGTVALLGSLVTIAALCALAAIAAVQMELSDSGTNSWILLEIPVFGVPLVLVGWLVEWFYRRVTR